MCPYPHVPSGKAEFGISGTAGQGRAAFLLPSFYKGKRSYTARKPSLKGRAGRAGVSL